MHYVLQPEPGTGVVRDFDGAQIPDDPDNGDWRAYQTWLATGNTPSSASVPATVVPQTISSRQFYQQLAVQGVITEAEAIAAMSGAIPPELTVLINQLPAAQQFPATMLIVGAPTFDRSNPVTLALGQGFGWTTTQIDALWTAAAKL